MTVVRKCGSSKGGVTSIRKVCKLMERCDGHLGGVKGCGEGLFDSHWRSARLRNSYLRQS